MYGSLEVSTSGLIAQRTRIDAIASNLANANTVLDSQGNLNPYKRREVYFASGNPLSETEQGKVMGVHVAQILQDDSQNPPRTFNPDHPYAYKDGPWKGYVAETNVDTVRENVNLVEAMRAYEANIMAAEASKSMMASALRLIA